jgi:hypothetical protein
VGSVLSNLTGLGYGFSPTATDPSVVPYQGVSLALARRANPQCKCMLFNIAATWCEPSNAQQAALKDLATTYPGTCLVESLIEGITRAVTSTKGDLDGWVATHRPTFPIMQEAPTARDILYDQGGDAYMPLNVMVQTSTMKITGIVGLTDLSSLLASCPR